jgi:ATP/maltotriose-dependent transcriptional regulator MalT
LAQNKQNLSGVILEFEDESYQELSLSEWKKFKSFEQKLGLTGSNDSAQQLRSYARDSIQILGVKLMAIKLLDEKALLEKDIIENGTFYNSLLKELRESAIPKTEYLFLEEKLAYLNQAKLQNELALSKWLNLTLVVLCLLLGIMTYRIGKKTKGTPTLSKQEITVRDLILQGKTNKEIANELFISLSTVKSHITNIYSKLNIANRQELFQKSTGTST